MKFDKTEVLSLKTVSTMQGPAALAIGAFDGIHVGHRELITTTINQAQKLGIASAVITFEPHPSEKVRGCRARLTTPQEKLRLISQLAPDYILVLDFDEPLSKYSGQRFAREILKETIGAVMVNVGFNFHFGEGGKCDAADLTAMGEELGFSVNTLEPVLFRNEPVSSSRIRKAISLGPFNDGATMLGRQYFIGGTVIHGRKVGRKLGFPTANLKPCDSRKLLPAFGVYAGRVYLDADYLQSSRFSSFPCLISVGVAPTFCDEKEPSIEVYIPGFDGSLYESTIAVEFCSWIRAEQKFASKEELIARINKDFDTLVSMDVKP